MQKVSIALSRRFIKDWKDLAVNITINNSKLSGENVSMVVKYLAQYTKDMENTSRITRMGWRPALFYKQL